MNDPSNGVPHALLPHIHLVCTYKWPSVAHIGLDTIVEYLLQAPKITKEVAPMNWMYIDAPPDGTVMLVWQPLAQLGTRFASDGYIWADAEQSFSMEARGYTVEMFIHRTGYHPSETMATHSRRRYRLTQSANANPNQPPCDESLWIVHYSRADPANQLPTNRIAMNAQIHQTMSVRKYLQQHGQLIRKEFMLGDRNSWPTINPPTSGQIPQYSQQIGSYPGNVIQHMNRSQQQSYLQNQYSSHPGIAPSSAKRPRHAPPNQRPGSTTSIAAMAMAQESSLEEEEDTHRGDLMDSLTPRDISAMRYIQHHEWMEEIFGSPYSADQIVPVELGLGRKGELESLTGDFFDAPVGKTPMTPDDDNSPEANAPRFKRIDSRNVDDFAKRASEKIAQINAEMEKMKKLHAKRMAKLGQGRGIRDAERHLRSVVTTHSTEGSIWESNGQMANSAGGDLTVALLRQQGRVGDIAREVETSLNRKIEVIHSFKCVQKGGLEEKASPEIPPIEDPVEPIEEPMADTDVPSFPEFDDKTDWMQEDIIPDPTPTNETPAAAPAQETSIPEMSDPQPNPEPPVLSESGDWVMVDPPAPTSPPQTSMPDDSTAPIATTIPTTTEPLAASTMPTALSTDLPDFGTDVPDLQGEGFETNEFDQAVDFGNLDTAGDALDGFDVQGDDGLGGDAGMGLMLEDSAFGDAFHHTTAEVEADGLGQDQGQVESGAGLEVEVEAGTGAAVGQESGEGPGEGL